MMADAITIADTEISKGDLIRCPISRQKTVSHLEVIGVEKDRVYLDNDGKRFTMHTEEAITFATLSANDGSFGPVEILAVEQIEIEENEDMPCLEDIEVN